MEKLCTDCGREKLLCLKKIYTYIYIYKVVNVNLYWEPREINVSPKCSVQQCFNIKEECNIFFIMVFDYTVAVLMFQLFCLILRQTIHYYTFNVSWVVSLLSRLSREERSKPILAITTINCSLSFICYFERNWVL